MPNIRVTASIPDTISDASIRGHILATLQRYERRLKTELESTSVTFENVSVTWKSEVRYAGGQASVEVSTDSEIWGYLDEGTWERWAVMRPEFRPKTFKRELFASAGSRNYINGYYTVIKGMGAMSRRGMGPMPGIEAREWTDMLLELYSDDFVDDIRMAVYGSLDPWAV